MGPIPTAEQNYSIGRAVPSDAEAALGGQGDRLPRAGPTRGVDDHYDVDAAVGGGVKNVRKVLGRGSSATVDCEPRPMRAVTTLTHPSRRSWDTAYQAETNQDDRDALGGS
jgi:hypothetical protein